MPTLFFFQAEDGIRDGRVTGVQTCALPILWLAVDLLLLGAVPLAGLSAYLASGALTRRAALRIAAAVAYRSEERRVGKEGSGGGVGGDVVIQARLCRERRGR